MLFESLKWSDKEMSNTFRGPECDLAFKEETVNDVCSCDFHQLSWCVGSSF